MWGCGGGTWHRPRQKKPLWGGGRRALLFSGLQLAFNRGVLGCAGQRCKQQDRVLQPAQGQLELASE